MSNGQPVVWYAHKCLAPSGPVVVKDCRSEIERGRAGSCGFFTMDFEGTRRIEKLYHHITQFILKILKVAMRKQSSGPASMKTWGMPSKGVVFILRKCSLPFKLFCSCADRLPVEKSQYSINIHTHEISNFFERNILNSETTIFSFTSCGLPLDRLSFKKQYAWKIWSIPPKWWNVRSGVFLSTSVNKSSLPSMGIPLKGENPAQYAVCLILTHGIPVKQME